MSRWALLVLVLPLFLWAKEEYPSPTASVARMKVPEGFRVRLVAGEPTLIKPIAMATDERGRLWVVESHSYPHWLTETGPGKDRVLILEPTPDGTYTCKVFLDNGVNLSGITVGFGGVWLTSVPKLIFIPVKDDKPAGPAVVHLDGFSTKTKHNVVNSLAWGPDGWLYGLNGIQTVAKIGPPGTPEKDRAALDCGVWRYHPTRKKAEAYAWGTTNPWGLDWDDQGEMFITNCVIKHLFHVVPGAHFVRMYGQDLNPHTYGLIESCADHLHWGGGDWTTSRGGKGAHSVTGGGHAHAGALFYLGDNWPKEYRNRILMANIHGNRLNQDRVERRGSGYVARHCEDFLLANDEWFRGLGLTMAADGGVYVSDWHDTGECHNYDKTHPSGRIYKVTFGSPRHPAVDLAKQWDAELVRHQASRNEWAVRHARRMLQERAVGGLTPEVAETLWMLARNGATVPARLRGLWALHAIGKTDAATLQGLLTDPAEAVRVWAVRLLVDHERMTPELGKTLAKHAAKETSAAVRLALASALQRAEPAAGWPLAEALAARAEDAGDAYLPLMIWYGVEPGVAAAPERAARFATTAKIPLVRQHVARRLASLPETAGALELVAKTLAACDKVEVQRDLLVGVGDALLGRRGMTGPKAWADVYRKLGTSGDAAIRERVLALSLLFGNADAVAELKRTVGDVKADAGTRSRALEALLTQRSDGVAALLPPLLDDPAMRAAALRGMANYDDPQTPKLILARYAALTDAEKADAVSTLASRPAFALALLDAIDGKRVPRADVTTFTARQMLAMNSKPVRDRLNAVWGSIRPAAKDKDKLLAKYKELATGDADRAAGRAVYAKTCASCHALFGEGGKIGPDLTGSQRTNPEYILGKVLDPNAVVPADFQVTRLVTVQGRVITGVVKQETDKVLVVQTATEELRVLKADLEERGKLGTSLMPEGQLATLSDAEVRDLLAYLAGKEQVPLPKGK